MAKFHQRGAPSLKAASLKGGKLQPPPPPKKIKVSASRMLLSLMAILALLVFFLIVKFNQHSTKSRGSIRKGLDTKSPSSKAIASNDEKDGDAESEREELLKMLGDADGDTNGNAIDKGEGN